MSPLPDERDFTAVDSGPLSAATVNNIQDSIVNLNNGQSLPLKLTLNDPDGQPPVFSVTDSSARVRHYWDGQGLICGAGVWTEDYGVDGGITLLGAASSQYLPGKLDAEAEANTEIRGQTLSIGGGTPGFGGIVVPYCRLIIEPSATNEFCSLHSPGPQPTQPGKRGAFSNFTTAYLEGFYGVETLIHTGADYYFGFTEQAASNTPEATGNDMVIVSNRAGDTNWHLLSSTGIESGIDDHDTGVAPPTLVTQFIQHFKLEYHGLLTPLGALNGHATARLFIDGALVGERTGVNVPENRNGYSVMAQNQASGGGPSTDRRFHVGPQRYTYVPYLADLSPV